MKGEDEGGGLKLISMLLLVLMFAPKQQTPPLLPNARALMMETAGKARRGAWIERELSTLTKQPQKLPLHPLLRRLLMTMKVKQRQ
jgi:hypothetical protein